MENQKNNEDEDYTDEEMAQGSPKVATNYIYEEEIPENPPEPEFKRGDKVVVINKNNGYVYNGLRIFHAETDSSYILFSEYDTNMEHPIIHAKNGDGAVAVKLEKFTPKKEEAPEPVDKKEKSGGESLKDGDLCVIFDRNEQKMLPSIYRFHYYTENNFAAFEMHAGGVFYKNRYSVFKCPLNYNPNTGDFS